ncbi:hypothetical protein GALMADRAFT_217073 [Galerina marginata CBS 339.88]|uniref:Uncharacterized protein n=1 Tax=Galerina marginata (strain CBS 339.88) TaxID=685588 RepID=A0A067SHU0_GALM3|nr:hypothetical protein GALMADRAFT_217073 [Galerina marginata CBS 339.88]
MPGSTSLQAAGRTKLKSPPVYADLIRAQVAIDVGVNSDSSNPYQTTRAPSLQAAASAPAPEAARKYKEGRMTNRKQLVQKSPTYKVERRTSKMWWNSGHDLKDSPKSNTSAGVAVCTGAARIGAEVDGTGVEMEHSAWTTVEWMEVGERENLNADYADALEPVPCVAWKSQERVLGDEEILMMRKLWACVRELHDRTCSIFGKDGLSSSRASGGPCNGTEHIVSAGAAAVQDPSLIVMRI